jgi:hypothetical protein
MVFCSDRRREVERLMADFRADARGLRTLAKTLERNYGNVHAGARALTAAGFWKPLAALCVPIMTR